jgi:hypothetical protein
MSEAVPTVEDDLAYLRRLVDSDHGSRVRRKFGVVYLFSGLIWGAYSLVIWAANARLITLSKELNGALWLVVMVLFFGAIGWSAWRDRGASRATTPTRAFSGAFAGIGMSYLVMLAVLRREGWIALVAIGWYLAALLTGFSMQLPDFLLCMAISMLVLMALPGWLLIGRNPVTAA